MHAHLPLPADSRARPAVAVLDRAQGAVWDRVTARSRSSHLTYGAVARVSGFRHTTILDALASSQPTFLE